MHLPYTGIFHCHNMSGCTGARYAAGVYTQKPTTTAARNNPGNGVSDRYKIMAPPAPCSAPAQ